MINKKLAIINASPLFYNEFDNCYYLGASEYKSLNQFSFFSSITLLKPVGNCSNFTGLVKVPLSWSIYKICDVGLPYFKRKSSVTKNIDIFCKNNLQTIYYLRMPSYEAGWSFKVLKKNNCIFFSELHGDWVESIIAEDFNSIYRKITREYRAMIANLLVKKICKNSIFCMTIGRSLTKYIPSYIPNLITTNHLLSRNDYAQTYIPKIEKDIYKLLFVGDIQKRKGLEYLIKALDFYIRENNWPKIHLDIIGDGVNFHELYKLCEDLNLNSFISFHGRIQHGEYLLTFFRNADLFILPSIASEGVPRVTHEAMALGCPVIATNIGSIKWQLENDCGVLVEPKNPILLKNAIQNLLTDINLLNYYGKNGHNYSFENSLENQRKRYESFILNNLNF